MIKNNVVLILGAGASAPYRFPLGNKLMSEVINRLKGVGHFNELLNDFGFTIDLQQQFADELRDSMQPSIDAFVQDREDFVELGKATIAASLIPYEHKSDLMRRDFELDEQEQDKRWYGYLLNLLGTRDNFRENNLSIITFNYDRSLEFFLFNAIKPRFHLDDQAAAEFIKTIPVVHMYGQLGQPIFLNEKGRDYDSQLTSENLKKSMDEIHLIYENRDEARFNAEVNEAYMMIQKANLLIFIGFGYHEKNIERLRLRDLYKGEAIIATFYGRAPGERERDIDIIKAYSATGNNSIPIKDYYEAALDFLKNTNFLK